MSKRRDWAKVHLQDNVARKGALPVGQRYWDPEMEMQGPYKGTLCYETSDILKSTLKDTIFTCNRRRCKPNSTMVSSTLNDIPKATPAIESEFQTVQQLVNEDFDKLVNHIALSNPQAVLNGTVSAHREFMKLSNFWRAQSKRPHAYPENPELEPINGAPEIIQFPTRKSLTIRFVRSPAGSGCANQTMPASLRSDRNVSSRSTPFRAQQITARNRRYALHSRTSRPRARMPDAHLRA